MKAIWSVPGIVIALIALMGLLTAAAPPDKSLTSKNGVWTLSATGAPQVLMISRAGDSEPLRRYQVLDALGKKGRVTCLVEAPSRQSFFAILGTSGEIWEMSYDRDAKPVFPGFVHNYREGQVEGIAAEPQPFARRRLHLPLDHNTLIFSPDHAEVIGYDDKGRITVFNLDARRIAGRLSPGLAPLLADSHFLEHKGKPALAIRDGKTNLWHLYSTDDWHEVGVVTEPPSKALSNNFICG